LAAPIAMVVYIAMGSVIGGLGAFIVMPSTGRRENILLTVLATAFGNAFALPFPLMASLCRAAPWLANGQEACEERAVAILIFGAICEVMILWSIGYFAVSHAMKGTSVLDAQCSVDSKSVDLPTVSTEGSCAVNPDFPQNAQATTFSGADGGTVTPPAPCVSFEAPPPKPDRQVTIESVRLNMLKAKGRCKALNQALGQVLNPVLIASILGLVVGSFGPFRKWLVASPVMLILEGPARACIPVTLLALGGQMMSQPSTAALQSISLRAVLWVSVFRLVFLNVTWTAAIAGAVSVGLLPRSDKLLQLCLMINGSMPTAANVVLMCSALDAFPTELSRVVFVMQVLCIPVSAVSIAVYLNIIESF